MVNTKFAVLHEVHTDLYIERIFSALDIRPAGAGFLRNLPGGITVCFRHYQKHTELELAPEAQGGTVRRHCWGIVSMATTAPTVAAVMQRSFSRANIVEALELFGVRANARTSAKALKVQLVQHGLVLVQDQAVQRGRRWHARGQCARTGSPYKLSWRAQVPVKNPASTGPRTKSCTTGSSP